MLLRDGQKAYRQCVICACLRVALYAGLLGARVMPCTILLISAAGLCGCLDICTMHVCSEIMFHTRGIHIKFA